MTTTTFTCDLCHSPIATDRHLLRAESGSLRQRLEDEKADLCAGCFSRFLAWLEGTEGKK